MEGMDERKREILERRERHRKLSEVILAGTEYFETIAVRGRDGKDHEVDVYALSEREFREALANCGVDPSDLGRRERLAQNLQFVDTIARIATRDPEIDAVLAPQETAKIMMKAFEISGLSGPFRPSPGDVRGEPLEPGARGPGPAPAPDEA